MALGVFAALVVILELIDATRQRRKAQLARYEAEEWQRRAEACGRVILGLVEDLNKAYDQKPLVWMDGSIVH